MPGKKILNSDLDLKGKAIISTVPNSVGTVLTYNGANKEVSTRSNPEFINDLSLMTTNTVQQVTAQKIFNNVDFPFQFRYAGTKSWTFQKVASGNSFAFLPSTTVNGTDMDTNNWIGLNDNGTIYTSGVYKRNSNDGYFLLGGSGHMLTTAKEDSFKTSVRNADGILITTDLDYSQSAGAAWLLELKGNMHGGGTPLVATIQGYVYNDTMINVGGVTTVDYFNNILVTNLNGKICFWFPKFFYWQGFSARMLDVTSAGDAAVKNHVMSIEEFTMDPGGTKRVNIPITVLSNSTNGWTGLPTFNTWQGHGVITERKVIGEMAWKYYGNGHTIVDVSSGFAPDGTTVSRDNSQIPWGSQYPMLVGWNGYQTYGLKVDTARRAEELGNYGAQNYVTVFSEQEIYGLKRFTQRFRNTGTGWGNDQVVTNQSILFDTGNGTNSNNWSTFSMGFFSTGTSVQAGIYVRSNSSVGTQMAFATTNAFASGPQIAMTINHLGTVDFPRAWPTVSGKNIFHGGNTIDYDHGVADIITVGDSSWQQRKVLSTSWDGTYGDHVILRPPGLAANLATFKLSQNGYGYIGDKRILTDADFNANNFVKFWEGAFALGFSNGNPNNAPYIYSNVDGSYRFLATNSYVMNNYLPLSGGTLTNGGVIDGSGNITVQQAAGGMNTTGVFWKTIDDSANISGIGSLTTNGTLNHLFMGWGPEPWDVNSNLSVASDRFTYKNNNIWHAGNLNPVKIGGAGTFNNPIYLGWDNNNIRVTVDNSYIGNVWHSNNFNPTNKFSIDRTAGINNGSDSRNQTTWFDYNWAGIGLPGEVISFGGFNGYQAELFIQYNAGGMNIGARSRNGNNTGSNWNPPRMLWHNGHFTQADVDHWKSLSTGIMLNTDFTSGPNGTGNNVAISDNSFEDESGLWDLNYEYAIAVKWGDDYVYGGGLGGYPGISWNITNQNVGIGMKATTAAKVNVLGAVKASGNFKSTSESANETFIANGTTAKLDKEVKNVAHPSGETGLRVEPSEYFVPPGSFLTVDDDNRFLVIIGERTKQIVNLINIYPRQSINIYNFDPQGLGLDVQINGSYLMTIPGYRMQEYWVTQDQRLIRKNGQVECEFIY